MASLQPGHKKTAGGATSRVDWSYDRRKLRPFTVEQYIEEYSDWLHCCHLSAKRLTSYVREICELCTRRLQDTGVTAWVNQQWQWGGCSASDSLCHFNRKQNLYVCCIKEVGYEQHAGDILQQLEVICFTERLDDPVR